MVIFHSYVKLPEGSYLISICTTFTWWFTPVRQLSPQFEVDIAPTKRPLLRFKTRLLTYLLSGMNHQVMYIYNK